MNVNEILLVDSIVEFYILLLFCLLFLLVVEMRVVESPAITEFVYFSFSFYHKVFIDNLQGFLVTL